MARLGSTVIEDFKQFRVQQLLAVEMLSGSVRFLGIAAGRGSGKSVLTRRGILGRAMFEKPWPDPRYFYGAPTRDQVKRLAWEPFKALIPKPWLVDLSESELWIDLDINGYVRPRIQLIGFDRPERFEGMQWDGGAVDESCDIKPGTFERSILPALSHRDGFCWRLGVPKRQGVGAADFKRFCLRAREGKFEIPGQPNASAAYFNWSAEDVIPANKLALLQVLMDPKDYREQIKAQWETAGGGIFHAFDSRANLKPCVYRPELPLLVGGDFNVDPMAWVVGHKHGETLEWFDELWLRDANTPAALSNLWNKYQTHKSGFLFFLDASSTARKTSASMSDYIHILNDPRFKAAGRRIVFPGVNPDGNMETNPPRKDRFSSCNAMFCNAAGQRRMFIDPRCQHLIEDVEARHYLPGSMEPADGGDLGHATDAMGYVVHKLFPMRLEVEETKSIIYSNAGSW